MEARKILVKGIVQGVGFRPFIYRLATRFNLVGHVKNLGDAGVEIFAAGQHEKIEEFINAITKEKVKNARIDEITSTQIELPDPLPEKFHILESGGLGAPGTIPPDTAMCPACLDEIFDEKNIRRFFFPFNSCTDCGSRLSTIHRLPYDRQNTSLHKFAMCNDCQKEYENPDDRRFHYQGITCKNCGPSYTLHDAEGKPFLTSSVKNLIENAITMLREGKILAIKGLTGTHIAVKITDDSILKKFRKTFTRPQKPFAIMAGDMNMVNKIANVTPAEKDVILSSARPIVLLKSNESSRISKLVSPELHNIGTMLPYAGIHHLIFKYLDEPLLMTSANFPGQPMLTENSAIIEKLRGVVDGFLLHNLDINNRCDDSVVKVVGETPLFIRRSRGYAPSTIRLPFKITKTILCLGSELNNTVCLIKGSEAHLSQYIGDTRHTETMEYLSRAIDTLLEMTRTKYENIDAVTVDLNPAFDLKFHAEKFCREKNLKLFPVQHHIAHSGSITGECGEKEIVVIAIDGIGYGLDGKIWGGEIFTIKNRIFERAGHLEEQKMPGGDLATIFPLKMLAGILFEPMGSKLRDFLLEKKEYFKYGKQEIDVLLRQIEKGINVVMTTSCGRVLDSISALLDICYERTYDGEPAMKLEAIATEPSFELPVVIKNGIFYTTPVVLECLKLVSAGKDPRKIAASAQTAIARGLAKMAIHEAKQKGIKTVGLTGGVAYNEMIHLTIKNIVLENNLNFVTNQQVPCGDGGISFGQGIALSLISDWIE